MARDTETTSGDNRRFSRLVEIMALLRSEQGCPWDREQTHASLRQHLLEEAYEVIETIDEGRYEELAGELGDVLLQVVFHAQMAAEAGLFTIEDVLEHINNKLERRHPHIFGDAVIKTAAEQTVAWEQSKLATEGKKSAIDGVPKELPALIRAYRIQNKAAAVGFDWPDAGPVWDKIREEVGELEEAVGTASAGRISDELGDLLFSIVNVSRFLKINPEDALRGTIEKFSRRFHAVEEELHRQGRRIEDSSLTEMDRIWDEVKREERS
ncbi:MAG TPA: nucleoside triphosphate pyrophosphohydrolase [bacterium]|nr:nucleoside triphosphate pyrophosphohydrolase [bacterium]